MEQVRNQPERTEQADLPGSTQSEPRGKRVVGFDDAAREYPKMLETATEPRPARAVDLEEEPMRRIPS